jgi:hypothetical protein
VSASRPRPPADTPVALAGMRVCGRPAECPYVAPERSLATDLGRWHSALDAALPGDAALVVALVGDIAALALPAL